MAATDEARESFLQRVRAFKSPLHNVGGARTGSARIPKLHPISVVRAVHISPERAESGANTGKKLAFSHCMLQCAGCGRLRRWDEASESIGPGDSGGVRTHVPPSAYDPSNIDTCGKQTWHCSACKLKNPTNRRVPVDPPTSREMLWASELELAAKRASELRELLAAFQPERPATSGGGNGRKELPPLKSKTRESQASAGASSPSLKSSSVLSHRAASGGNVALKTGWSPSPVTARSAFINKCEELSVVPLARLCHGGVVSIAHYRIGDQTAVAFAEMLRRSRCVSLDLEDNSIRWRGAVAICDVIRNKPELRLLDFSNNRIGRRGCKALGVAIRDIVEYPARHNSGASEQLDSAALTTTPESDEFEAEEKPRPDDDNELESGKFVTLRLARNDLSDSMVSPVLDVLPSIKSLTQLDLSFNKIGASVTAAAALSSALTALPRLEDLGLQWNLMNGTAAETLMESVMSHTSLKSLDLGFNNLGERGGIAVGNMLRENSSLTSLSLQRNHINPKATLVICDGISVNNERAKKENLRTLNSDEFHPLRMSTLCTKPLSVSMQGNPVGKLGGRAMVQLGNNCGRQLKINLNECDFAPMDPDEFDPKCCGGAWVLHLDHPYEHAIAQELLRISREHARLDDENAHDDDDQSDSSDSDTDQEDEEDDNFDTAHEDSFDDPGEKAPSPKLPQAPGLFLTTLADKQNNLRDTREEKLRHATRVRNTAVVIPASRHSSAAKLFATSSRNSAMKPSNQLEKLKRQIASHKGEVTHRQHRKMVARKASTFAAGAARRTAASKRNTTVIQAQVVRRRSHAMKIPTFSLMYDEARWCWHDVKYNGKPVKHNARIMNWALPDDGLLELDMDEPKDTHKGRSAALKVSAFARLFKMLDNEDSRSKGDEHNLFLIRAACDDTFFTAKQAKVLALMIEDMASRISAVRCLYGRIVDIDNRDQVFAVIKDKKALLKLQKELGDYSGLNLDNAIGFYSLNLERPEQRELALRLFELNSEEVHRRRRRRKGGLIDLSQHGNWCAFRNLTFYPKDEHQPTHELPNAIADWTPTMSRDLTKPIFFMYDPDWEIPRRGRLELDFVIWRRPPKHATKYVLGYPSGKADESYDAGDAEDEDGFQSTETGVRVRIYFLARSRRAV